MWESLDTSDHPIHQIYSLLQWPAFPVFNKLKNEKLISLKQPNIERKSICSVFLCHLEKYTSFFTFKYLTKTARNLFCFLLSSRHIVALYFLAASKESDKADIPWAHRQQQKFWGQHFSQSESREKSRRDLFQKAQSAEELDAATKVTSAKFLSLFCDCAIVLPKGNPVKQRLKGENLLFKPC